MSEETVKIKLHTIATYNNKEYELEELCNNLLEEIERLNNIINELEKWFKESYEVVLLSVILDKIQELKENVNEKKIDEV